MSTVPPFGIYILADCSQENHGPSLVPFTIDTFYQTSPPHPITSSSTSTTTNDTNSKHQPAEQQNGRRNGHKQESSEPHRRLVYLVRPQSVWASLNRYREFIKESHDNQPQLTLKINDRIIFRPPPSHNPPTPTSSSNTIIPPSQLANTSQPTAALPPSSTSRPSTTGSIVTTTTPTQPQLSRVAAAHILEIRGQDSTHVYVRAYTFVDIGDVPASLFPASRRPERAGAGEASATDAHEAGGDGRVRKAEGGWRPPKLREVVATNRMVVLDANWILGRAEFHVDNEIDQEEEEEDVVTSVPRRQGQQRGGSGGEEYVYMCKWAWDVHAQKVFPRTWDDLGHGVWMK